jgi:hypothetical protein
MAFIERIVSSITSNTRVLIQTLEQASMGSFSLVMPASGGSIPSHFVAALVFNVISIRFGLHAKKIHSFDFIFVQGR